jgi:hypothetical protein
MNDPAIIGLLDAWRSGDAQARNRVSTLVYERTLAPDCRAQLGETYLRQALAIKRNVLGKDHALTLDSLQALSVLLRDKGDMAAWEPVVRELVAGVDFAVWRASPTAAQSKFVIRRSSNIATPLDVFQGEQGDFPVNSWDVH